LEDLIQANPNLPSLHARRLRVRLAQLRDTPGTGSWPLAAEDLLKVTELRPLHVLPRGPWPGRLSVSPAEMDRLREELDGRIGRDPKDWRAWAARGQLNLSGGRWQAAASDLAEATVRSPERPWLWSRHTAAALKCGKTGAAGSLRRLAGLARSPVPDWH